MKTPFRLQISEYDCVPTTFINAITFLFERNEIPPTVIHKIYLYSLDTITTRQNIGYGTSGFAVQMLGNWLESYKKNKFSLSSEYMEHENIHLKGGNKISKCVNEGGVALLRVHTGNNGWHFILVLSIANGSALCFDPYPKKNSKNFKGKLKFINSPDMCLRNLEINTAYLDTYSNKSKYCIYYFKSRPYFS